MRKDYRARFARITFSRISFSEAGAQTEFCILCSKHRTLSLEFGIHIVLIIYVFKQSRDSNFENFLSGQTMVGPRFFVLRDFLRVYKEENPKHEGLIGSFYLRPLEGLCPIL